MQDKIGATPLPKDGIANIVPSHFQQLASAHNFRLSLTSPSEVRYDSPRFAFVLLLDLGRGNDVECLIIAKDAAGKDHDSISLPQIRKYVDNRDLPPYTEGCAWTKEALEELVRNAAQFLSAVAPALFDDCGKLWNEALRYQIQVTAADSQAIAKSRALKEAERAWEAKDYVKFLNALDRAGPNPPELFRKRARIALKRSSRS